MGVTVRWAQPGVFRRIPDGRHAATQTQNRRSIGEARPTPEPTPIPGTTTGPRARRAQITGPKRNPSMCQRNILSTSQRGATPPTSPHLAHFLFFFIVFFLLRRPRIWFGDQHQTQGPAEKTHQQARNRRSEAVKYTDYRGQRPDPEPNTNSGCMTIPRNHPPESSPPHGRNWHRR